MAYQFETETCSRCGGSGKYSYNQMHGDVCYGCHGKGKRLTKKAKKMANEFAESLKVPVETLQVGEVIFAFNKFMRIAKIYVDYNCPATSLDRTVWYHTMIEFEDGIHGIGTVAGQMIRKAWSVEEKQEKLREILLKNKVKI